MYALVICSGSSDLPPEASSIDIQPVNIDKVKIRDITKRAVLKKAFLFIKIPFGFEFYIIIIQ